MSEEAHFLKGDGATTLCGKPGSEWISRIIDADVEELCPECLAWLCKYWCATTDSKRRAQRMSDFTDWRIRRRLERILEASGMDGVESSILVRVAGEALDELCTQLSLQEQDALDKLSFTLHSLPIARGFLSEDGE